MKKKMLAGIAAAVFLGAGTIAVINLGKLGDAAHPLADGEMAQEIVQYEAALMKAEEDIASLKEQVAALSEKKEAEPVHAEPSEVSLQEEASMPTLQQPEPETEAVQSESTPSEPTAPLSPMLPKAEQKQEAAPAEPISAIISFEASPSGNTSAPDAVADTQQETWDTQEEADGWKAAKPVPVDLEAFAQEVLTLTNEKRAEAGLNSLSADQTLSEMAMHRARELEATYSHTRPNGENCKTIFKDYETDLRFYGENASKGQKAPEDVVQAWMDSSGHRDNLLREGAQYLGVGVWQDADGILYWEQLFAASK